MTRAIWILLSSLMAFALPDTIHLPGSRFNDIYGKTYTLGSDKEAIAVFIAFDTGCPIMRRYAETIRALTKKYQSRHVRFFAVMTSTHASAQELKKEMREYSFGVPVLYDKSLRLAKALQFKVTSEVVILVPDSGITLYRGAIDDSQTFDGTKTVSKSFLDADLAAYFQHQPLPFEKTKAFGCVVNYE